MPLIAKFLRKIFRIPGIDGVGLHDRKSFGDPPPPDTTPPQFAGLIETLFSHAHMHRAVICSDASGHFRIHRQRWWIGEWEICGDAFWEDDGKQVTIVEDLQTARDIALDYLRTAT